MNIIRRPRRLRTNAAVRALVEETTVSVNDLILPVFLVEGTRVKKEVASMPGIYRHSLDNLLEEIAYCRDLGIKTFDIFPGLAEEKKDRFATESHRPGNMYLEAIHAVKSRFPDVVVMTDVAMDPYSSDGHDGLVENGEILNDETLEILGKMALAQAQVGADILGPSDMMDGRVGYLREILDDNGFTNVAIMSYTAKYASSLYSPFRDALESAPKFGDKKTYQMNPANIKEAMIEAELDYAEGADYLMVKPAMLYLDIIKMLNDNFALPIAAYNISGEYSLIKAGAQNGWIDGQKVMLETLTSIKRAGAKIILTYFAKEFAELQRK